MTHKVVSEGCKGILKAMDWWTSRIKDALRDGTDGRDASTKEEGTSGLTPLEEIHRISIRSLRT